MLLECAHCGKGQDKPWTANAARARIHLSGVGTGVKACLKVPDSIRILFKKASSDEASPSKALVQKTLVGGDSAWGILPDVSHKKHSHIASSPEKREEITRKYAFLLIYALRTKCNTVHLHRR